MKRLWNEDIKNSLIGGVLSRLQIFAFPSGTGISHTFINNTSSDIRLLVVGEATKKENGCFYPLHPDRNEEAKKEGWLWKNPPNHRLGPHDGWPDKKRPKL